MHPLNGTPRPPITRADRMALTAVVCVGLCLLLVVGLHVTDLRIAYAQAEACVAGPHSGTISADQTWCAADSPHALSGDVVVAPGVVLTIEPGVVVKGSSNVELKVQGRLVANGTAALPITFTSATDSGPNQWSGLIFDGGTGELNYATVRYGGNRSSLNENCSTSGLGFNIAVRNVSSGEVRLQNSQIQSEYYSCNNWQNADYGLYVENSRVTVDATLFQANGNASDDYPFYAFGASTVVTLTNSTFTANARQRVLFGGNVLSTWDANLAPQTGLEGYELAGDMTVPVSQTWTIQPGATLMGRDSVEIKVQGHLDAIGTSIQPITFTSATNTGVAQWSGLVFDGGTGDLHYTTVRYGGDPNSLNENCNTSGLGFNIAVRNVSAGEVRLENSQVLSERYNCNGWQNEDFGLYVVDSTVVVNNTLFQGIGNDTSDYPIYVQGTGSNLTLDGNTFTANPRNRVLLGANALNAANVELVDEAGLEGYELAGDYVVPAGLTLTLDPDVAIMGRSNVELLVLGHLSALGTPAQPISLTSATNTGADQWSGLIFDGGTGHLQHATVRYGGNINSVNGSCSTSGLGFNVAVRNVLAGEVRLEDSQIVSGHFGCNGWAAPDYGLYVNNSHVVVHNTLFQGNGNGSNDYAIDVEGASSTIDLAGNAFTGNQRNRVLLPAGAMTGASFSLVAETGLQSYEFPADFTIPAGITVTVEPGVMLMGRGNVELRTLGHLAAIGTPTQPITFTSATNTGYGQWSGLVFDGGTGNLKYTTVRYGGNVNSINGSCSTSGLGFNVAVRNVLAGEVRLENSQILSERYTCNNWAAPDYGLYVNNGHVTVKYTLIANNGSTSNDYAMYATGASSTVNFDGNVVRNNVRGVQLTGAGAQTLRNNVIMDNQLGGITIGASTTAQLLHTTIARNGGDGLNVASGGSTAATNTILADNVTGVRVNVGGAATLVQTLWDGNTTNTVGTVSQSGNISGIAAFDVDGYHLARYSSAIAQGVDAGVVTDIDGQTRPLPAATQPDLGADEYVYGYGEEFVFEKIALTPRWTAPGNIPGGTFLQSYLLRYQYGSTIPNPPPLNVSITDTLPVELGLENEDHYPAMSFAQNGQNLSWHTQQPVTVGQSGQIAIDTRYDNPVPGTVLTNTATLRAGTNEITKWAVTEVPIVAPLIVEPGSGELCAGQYTVRGLAQPGMTVQLRIDNVLLLQVQADASGQYTGTLNYAGTTQTNLTTQACTAGGQCSPVSTPVTLKPPVSFWCPQRSHWEGTPAVGPLAGQHLDFRFRDNTGQYSSQNWRIPGVFGFWNTTLHLRACNCPVASGTTAPPSAVWIIADGTRYDPTGVFPDYTFAVTGAAHTVVFWAQCGANQVSSSGHILIDPDGYVFDVTQGFDPNDPTLHAVAGVTVTAYISDTAWGGWVPWPAQVYNNQVNPQVTGADGYFAFFTPPGDYYLQVDGKPGYQPWRSPVIHVVDEIVHVNVPYTPWSNTTVDNVLLRDDGPQPAVVTVTVGSAVEWLSELDGLAPPAVLAAQTENPTRQPLSALNPISYTVGWDGGMLPPAHVYRRQMDSPGLYSYSDGLGHQGQVCVALREDVTGDGRVTVLDIQAVAQAWRTLTPGMDIDQDGDVDIVDTMRVAGRFGWQCGV